MSDIVGKVYFDRHPFYLIGPRHAFETDDVVTIYPKRLDGESMEVVVHREDPDIKDGAFQAYTLEYYEDHFADEVPF
jgi:hypothetical protein